MKKIEITKLVNLTGEEEENIRNQKINEIANSIKLETGLDKTLLFDILSEIVRNYIKKIPTKIIFTFKDNNENFHSYYVCEESQLAIILADKMRMTNYDNVPFKILNSGVSNFSSLVIKDLIDAKNAGHIKYLGDIFNGNEIDVALHYIKNVGIENYYDETYKINLDSVSFFILK